MFSIELLYHPFDEAFVPGPPLLELALMLVPGAVEDDEAAIFDQD